MYDNISIFTIGQIISKYSFLEPYGNYGDHLQKKSIIFKFGSKHLRFSNI